MQRTSISKTLMLSCTPRDCRRGKVQTVCSLPFEEDFEKIYNVGY